MAYLTSEAAKALKSAKGITSHNGSLRVQFKIPGRISPIKKSLGYPPTASNIELAKLTLANIKRDVANGLFDNDEERFWDTHFPLSGSPNIKNITVRECFSRYKEAYKGNLSFSVSCKLNTAFNWLEKFGYADKPLKYVTTDALNKMRGKTVTGNKRGAFEGCAASTVNEYSQTLGRVLSFAATEKFIKDNPMKYVHPIAKDDSKLDPEDRVVKPFTLAQLNSLLLVIHLPKIKGMVQFLAWTGLRPGELKALAWEDVNMEKKQINVRYNLTREGTLKVPKTQSSFRTIELLPAAYKILVEMQKFTSHLPAIEEVIHYKNAKTKAVLRRRVFLSRGNQPYKRPELTTAPKQWAKWLRQAEIPHRAAYQLRHTFASQLLTSGCDMAWLASQMGHKNWNMIGKIYGKWIPEDNPDYVKKLAEKLGQAY